MSADEEEVFFVPVVALSDSMNTPTNSPARRVSKGPGRFIEASPEASFLPMRADPRSAVQGRVDAFAVR
ncbi:hypothetical protein ACQEV2_08750 [Streptomyces sp. CA-251387]|uniref:hypothetical protein n=1 Tax=Streptomyces sp. CA-251387 TaxID=3240064 RepID=UPI003D8A9005